MSRRLPHDDEPRLLQVLDQHLGRELGRHVAPEPVGFPDRVEPQAVAQG